MSPVLVADIGGTKIQVGLVLPGNPPTVALRRAIPTEPSSGAESILRRLGTALLEVASAAEEVGHRPRAVGIASAGVIDSATGMVVSATDLIPGWGGTPLGPEAGRITGLPAHVLGDVHAHGLGEYLWGAASGTDSALVVAVGTGLGGAHVVGGEVLIGAHNVAGHVGHVLHPAAAGLRCSCGREGHLESVASGSGIQALYARVSGRSATGAEIDAAAAAGDSLAARVITIAGQSLGEIIGGLVNVLDPDVVVVSGSVANAGDSWWSALREGANAQAMDVAAQVPILAGTLGSHAPLIGAAAFAAGRTA